MITCWTWLDVRIRGYHLVADFAHAHGSITEPRANVHGRNRLPKWYITTSNHVQHVIKIYQTLFLLTLHANLNNCTRGIAWLRGYGAVAPIDFEFGTRDRLIY